MKLNSFQKAALLTVASTLLLIFIGGLVRASGAGLGCPDWPKCFGHWFPPSSASQLPPGIDKSLFNPTLMWIEYINRLFGVLTGFLITVTFILSFRYRKNKKSIFYASFAAFIMVLIEGWLGGQVVMTSLKAWMISIHMFLALAILLTLLFATYRVFSDEFDFQLNEKIRRNLLIAGGILLVFTLIQTGLGTQLRQQIDVLKDSAKPPPRELWLSMTGSIDIIHRFFSWTVVGAALYLAYVIKDFKPKSIYRKATVSILALIVLQVLLGLGLTQFNVFPPFQVLHLTNGALLVCAEFLLLIFVYESDKKSRSLTSADSISKN